VLDWLKMGSFGDDQHLADMALVQDSHFSGWLRGFDGSAGRVVPDYVQFYGVG
jgi:hypothetical protein